MRKICKLLVPAFIVVVFCASCEDPMEEMSFEFEEYLPGSRIGATAKK